MKTFLCSLSRLTLVLTQRLTDSLSIKVDLQGSKSTLTFQDGDKMESDIFCCDITISKFLLSV